MSNNKQSSLEQNVGYICPITKIKCDDECCVSAEDCHIKSWAEINSINNKQSSNHVPDVGKKVSSVEWLMQQIALKYGAFQAIAFYEENFKEFQQAKEMQQKQAQQYAEFCIECDRQSLPLIDFNSWISLNET